MLSELNNFNMNSSAHSSIHIKDYEVWVSLGCSKEEQSMKQPVHFNIEIEFQMNVVGETTDQLSDAVNYVTVTDLLKKISQSKSYQLIEHMCFQATESVFKYLIQNNIKGHLKIQLLKLRAPVSHLKSGVSWTCQRQLS